MLTKNYYMYPAILDYLNDGDIQLIFPDFEEEMEKNDVFIGRQVTDDEIYGTAVNYLFRLIHDRLKGCDDPYDDDDLPKPTSIKYVRPKEGQRSILVIVPQVSYGCDGLHLYSDSDDSRLRFGPKIKQSNNTENDANQIMEEMKKLLKRAEDVFAKDLKKLKVSTEDE